MKIEDIKIGMKVRIRQWGDLEQEFGLDSDGDIPGEFAFTECMRKFCGVRAEVVSINSNIVNLDKQFGYIRGEEYTFSADMLEPITEESTMPPPPDLGELHGVKLPAWFWNSDRECLIYVLYSFKGNSYIACFYDGKLSMSRNEGLEPYTGQDLSPKLSVDELKSLARLV